VQRHELCYCFIGSVLYLYLVEASILNEPAALIPLLRTFFNQEFLPVVVSNPTFSHVIRGLTRGARGEQFPGRWILWGRQITTTAGGAEWLWRAPKVPTVSQVLHFLPKTSCSNMGAPNVLPRALSNLNTPLHASTNELGLFSSWNSGAPLFRPCGWQSTEVCLQKRRLERSSYFAAF